MISCTEFIPAYSELFKFLEKKGGYDEVLRYWNYISDTYVETLLGELIDQKAMAGCWEYWTQALNEEAADFTMTFDQNLQEITFEMHRCPSKGLLMHLAYMEPYHAYCEHCAVIYEPVLNRRGIAQQRDHSRTGEAACSSRLYYMEKENG